MYTYKLEAAADGRFDVGTSKGGDLAELPRDLDGVVEEEAQTALVTETCCAGNLSEQDWSTEKEEKDKSWEKIEKRIEREKMMDRKGQEENRET